jgi:peptidoglycan/LPS O-acetylase OafA/YrhL
MATGDPYPTGRQILLSDFNFRSNAIGFLRVFFAGVVVWSHGFRTGGFGFDFVVYYSHAMLTAGLLAVGGFFVLSGFLITRSYETSHSAGRFLWHRFLRIFPGFWACLIVTALIFGPIAYVHEFGTTVGYLLGPDTPWEYIFGNALLVVRHATIGTITADLPFPNELNGSLWTLQWEFMCYVAIGVLGATTILSRKPVIVTLLTAAFLVVLGGSMYAFHARGLTVFSRLLLLITFFSMGSAAYSFRSWIPMRWWMALIAAVAMAAALPTVGVGLIVPPCLAYLVLYAAMKLPIRSFDRRVDLSYGLYVYAFPLQQLLTIYGFNRFGFPAYFGAAISMALAFATASWFLIEKPALSLKNANIGLPR